MDKNKIKRLLRWAFGALLALLSVFMLMVFLFTATAKRPYGEPGMTAADVILMWALILGAGAPGALLLRGAVRGRMPKAIEDDGPEGNIGEDVGEIAEEDTEEDVKKDAETEE